MLGLLSGCATQPQLQQPVEYQQDPLAETNQTLESIAAILYATYPVVYSIQAFGH